MKTPILTLIFFFVITIANAQYHFVYDSSHKSYTVYVDSGKSISKVDTFKCMVGYEWSSQEHLVDGFAVKGTYLTWTGKKWIRTDNMVFFDGNWKLITAPITRKMIAPNPIRGYHVHNDDEDHKLMRTKNTGS
jgi:hypothetical protein